MMSLFWRCYCLMLISMGLYSGSYGVLVNFENLAIRRWQFLTKFAFWTEDSPINMKLILPTYYNNVTGNSIAKIYPKLVIVTDNEENWEFFYKNNYDHPSVSCTKALSDLMSIKGSYQFDVRSLSNEWKGNSSVFIEMKDQIFVQSSTGHLYAFINLFMCDIPNQEYLNKNMDVYLELNNGKTATDFRYHISADHFYIFESLIFLVCAYIVMCFLVYCYNKAMTSENRYTPITFMTVLVIVTKFLTYIPQLIIMIVYSKTGSFSYYFFVAFEFFNILTIIIFMQIILCLAFGLTIKYGKLPYSLVVCNLVLGMVYCLITLLSIIITLVTYDTAATAYIYGSFAGYILVTVHFLVAIEFLVGCALMLKKYKDTMVFYILFLIIGLIWIISVPVLIICVNVYMKTYLKFSVVVITRNLIDLLGHFIFIILTYPNLFGNLIVYTTSPDKIANMEFGDANETVTEDSSQRNNDFLNLEDFQ